MLRRISKNALFSEKTVKNHMWEDTAILRERGLLVTKINVTFFVRNEVSNIFHKTFCGMQFPLDF